MGGRSCLDTATSGAEAKSEPAMKESLQALITPCQGAQMKQNGRFESSDDPQCPLCHERSDVRFRKNGYSIRKCRACKHEFTFIASRESHVASVYGDDYFFGGEGGYEDYLDFGPGLRARGARYARRLERYVEKGKVLDVGAAAGFLLSGFLDRGWTGVGIEPNARMAAHGTDELGVDVRPVSLEDFQTEEVFDAVILVQVVGHFVSPEKAVRQIIDLICPGGVCLIETWNRESLSARIFGQRWHEYNPPSVLQWYSVSGLTDWLSRYGLERLGWAHTFKKIPVASAKSLLRYHTRNSGLMSALTGPVMLLPDRLNLLYPGDDLFWVIFRKPA
jgi:2-polyprenyl-3-methyl-5-hydroxy-6-metoxy-1,4-benzoquinol methylase